MDDAAILIVGANGQLGQALRTKYPNAQAAASTELDIADRQSVEAFDWSSVRTILNAGAYTKVDAAETAEGRLVAWSVNAGAASNLARIAQQHGITLVHISTDYVFDGTQSPHSESEAFSPLSVYGQSKAAGDLVVSVVPRHYILRTSWVIGNGNNFVRTMLGLGAKGVAPTVVADQIGRLTFTSELVAAINHLLASQAEYGTYNVSNSGESVSWADITRAIFSQAGYDLTVTNTTTADYYAGKPSIAPRPLQSTLALDKIQASGFASTDWQEDLAQYIIKETAA